MSVVRIIVAFVFLFSWPIHAVKNRAFCITDTLVSMMNKDDINLNFSESFINSSIWVYHQQRGLRLQPNRNTFIRLLLLLCGDIETCPCPAIKCCSCLKTVRRNQSRARCTRCDGTIHLKCLNRDINEVLCLSCLYTVDHEDLSTPTAQGAADYMNANTTYELPELTELQSKRVLKILHQNIRGLLHMKLTAVKYYCSDLSNPPQPAFAIRASIYCVIFFIYSES